MTLKQLDHTVIHVAPSVLAADFSDLNSEISHVVNAGATIVHLDIMDGHFVPNITMGPPVVKSLRKITSAVFDAHLMITDPLKYLGVFADCGADHITFHIESKGEPEAIIKAIRDKNCSVGVTLKPGTSVDEIMPYLPEVDMVLVMTVEPGFGGQSFMADMMPKVRALRTAISKNNLKVHIQVDGGIDAETVNTVAAAGANVMVAGTSVFRNPAGVNQAIRDLLKAQDALDQAVAG